jgi:type IV secretory pathway VirB2 component (pilin)
MTIIASFQQAALTDAPASSAITAASGWVSDLIFGSLATSIAVIAIAWVGFAMLSGRIEVRRGLAVILGCFILFGARDIAQGIQSTGVSPAGQVAGNVPPPPVFSAPPKRGSNSNNGFDPYAGASVPAPEN